MRGDLVPGHVLGDEGIRPGHNAGPDDEERCRKVVVLEILQHLPVFVQGLDVSWRRRSNLGTTYGAARVSQLA